MPISHPREEHLVATSRASRALLVAFGVACALAASFCAAASAESFDAKGVKNHYLIEGKGEPVVLIHGLFSSAWINWHLGGVFQDLAKDHRVIALDLPAHGKSDRPLTKDAYGEQLVDDIALLLDHLKIKKAHIVGYSLGGMITVKFLAKHPDRVLSGTVGGMGWFREGSAPQKFWGLAKGPNEKKGFGPPPVFLQEISQLAVTEKELKKITAPVKVVVGDQDVCKQLYVVPLQQVRSDWPVVEIRDAGHFDCIVKPQFREEIGAWVRKNTK